MRPILVVAKQQRFCCHYCEHRMLIHTHIQGVPTPRDALTKDHVTPRVLGGETTPENLVAACSQCNFMRGEIDGQAFCNIVERWFTRQPVLWIRWHSIPWTEVIERKQHCYNVHERLLRGKAGRYPEFAYQHQDFTWRASRWIQQAA